MTNEQMNKAEQKQARKDAKALLKKPFYKRVWVWVLAVIVIIAIANSGGEEEAPTTETADAGTETEVTTDTNTEEATETSAPVEEEEVAGVGEAVTVGGVDFTVNSISTATNVGGEYGVNSQGTFLLVDVTVKNVGNEAITTDSSFFQLKSGEKTYDADGTAGIYANPDVDFFLEQVNPDLSATGKVVFDVSDEVIANPELMLQVQTGFFGTETGLIKIAE